MVSANRSGFLFPRLPLARNYPTSVTINKTPVRDIRVELLNLRQTQRQCFLSPEKRLSKSFMHNHVRRSTLAPLQWHSFRTARR